MISLPSVDAPGRRVDWRVDARGLEWTDARGKDRWMPFACVRLATLGHLKKQGWCLRLSGPPGALVFGAGANGAASAEDLAAFRELGQIMIMGASEAGCRARFRRNDGTAGFGLKWAEPLWARGGQSVANGQVLVDMLPAQSKNTPRA